MITDRERFLMMETAEYFRPSGTTHQYQSHILKCWLNSVLDCGLVMELVLNQEADAYAEKQKLIKKDGNENI